MIGRGDVWAVFQMIGSDTRAMGRLVELVCVVYRFAKYCVCGLSRLQIWRGDVYICKCHFQPALPARELLPGMLAEPAPLGGACEEGGDSYCFYRVVANAPTPILATFFVVVSYNSTLYQEKITGRRQRRNTSRDREQVVTQKGVTFSLKESSWVSLYPSFGTKYSAHVHII